MENKKIVKKYGLFISITMVIGTIIGIGIFFKNGSVFKEANNNYLTIIIAWIISGMIALSTAISFSEIGSISEDNKSGLSFFAKKLIGLRISKYIKVYTIKVYLAIIGIVICIFTALFLTNLFGYENVHFGIIFLIGSSIFIIILIFSELSQRFVGIFQNIFTIIKFFPILLVIFFGITGLNDAHDKSLLKNVEGSFNFEIVIAVLPAILFSFDGFLVVTEFGHKIKKPEKKLPIAILIGMTVIFILYLLTTLSQILIGNGNIIKIFSLISNSKAIEKIALTFLIISGLGAANAVIFSFLKAIDLSIKNDQLVFAKTFNKYRHGAFYYALTIFIFYGIVLGIPSIFNNTIEYYDYASNYPVLYHFVFYMIVIIAQIFNRFYNKVEFKKINSYLFYVSSFLAIIGISTMVIYQFAFIAFADFIKDSSNVKSIVFISSSLLFLLIPFSVLIRDAFLNKNAKKDFKIEERVK